MPLREGHEFLRGHLGHPSARISLSPDTKGAFLSGLPDAGHSFTSACRVMTPPRGGPGAPAGVLRVLPGAKRFGVGRDGWGDPGKTAVRIYVSRSRPAPPGATPGRRTECSVASWGNGERRASKCATGRPTAHNAFTHRFVWHQRSPPTSRPEQRRAVLRHSSPGE